MKPKRLIPSPLHSKQLLPSSLALTKEKVDEGQFRISFDHYNDNLCEIDDLQSSPARKCLSKLKQIGRSTHKTLAENNINPKPIDNSGRYKELFSKLSPDVSLFEIDIGSASRLFYFIVGNLFHIVSIKNSHIKY
ncbi:MAG: hypothetical protein WA347_08770 [Rhabdochlamydiaceae bacterium]|jgi:hypothetical protein